MLQRPWEKDCFFQASLFLPLLFPFLLTISLPQDSTQNQSGDAGFLSAVAALLVASLELVTTVHQVKER